MCSTDYAFPYLSIVISMVSNAAHFSMKLDQTMRSLFKTSFTEMKNATIIGTDWWNDDRLIFDIIS